MSSADEKLRAIVADSEQWVFTDEQQVAAVKQLASACIGIIQLHERAVDAKTGWEWCGECSDHESGLRIGWPCETLTTITDALEGSAISDDAKRHYPSDSAEPNRGRAK